MEPRWGWAGCHREVHSPCRQGCRSCRRGRTRGQEAGLCLPGALQHRRQTPKVAVGSPNTKNSRAELSGAIGPLDSILSVLESLHKLLSGKDRPDLLTFSSPGLCDMSDLNSLGIEPAPPGSAAPARLLCPWDSPGKSTGVSYHAVLQGILTQGSNPHLMCPAPVRWVLSCWCNKINNFIPWKSFGAGTACA